MNLSDLILTLIILILIIFGFWVADFNPLSNKLVVYPQSCTNMILDNTFCKGEWVDEPITAYLVDKENNSVISKTKDQDGIIQFKDCSIVDRKNWSCTMPESNVQISALDGIVTANSDTASDRRQITRLQWLQNKFLDFIK